MNKEIINILELLNARGEAFVQNVISTFSCSNNEVNQFLKERSIEFAKRRTAITYFYMNENGVLLGYFTILFKPFIVKKGVLPTSFESNLKSFRYKEDADNYAISGYLLAQLGKNENLSDPIHGDELLDTALNVILDAMNNFGNKIVWLECESDNDKALRLYSSDKFGFRQFGERYDEDENGNTIKYIMMLKLYKSNQLNQLL